MEGLKEFIRIHNGSCFGNGAGFGDGSGFGNSSGDGSGDGSGSSYISGSGDGSGYGSGSGGYGYRSGSGDGSGYGSGSCDSSGSGSGSGFGNGYCLGNGAGYGSCDGDGSGDSYGYGSGAGFGAGDGSCDGSGDSSDYDYGYGYGYSIKYFNKNKVHFIDRIPTVILSIKGFVAKGYIIKNDLTTQPCYIVRVGNSFAHGDTIKKAKSDAEAKHLLRSPIKNRIELFLSKFCNCDKIKANELYDWHFNLTGSCSTGRDLFVKTKQIDLYNDQFTISEFINLCKDQYGGDIIKQLEVVYNKRKKTA